jgi:hydrogenase maturation factor HypF (carbamoyltransferase family)
MDCIKLCKICQKKLKAVFLRSLMASTHKCHNCGKRAVWICDPAEPENANNNGNAT